MDDVIVNILNDVKLRKPVMIEGLPGVGNVGKLAADYLKDELKAIKFAEIFSKYFPPQVFIDLDGSSRLVNNELYYYKNKKNNFDVILMVGDYQGLTPDGQYELSDQVIKLAKHMGVQRIYTLAGLAQGTVQQKIKVWGAANNRKIIPEIEKYGVIFRRNDFGGSLVGASGLLLGIGTLYKIDAACLMGETSGYFIDPKSAEAVLKVITKILNIKLDFSNLKEKAKEIDRITQKFQEMEEHSDEKDKEHLNYFG